MLVDKLDKFMTRPEGFVLSERDLPKVSANEGWLFKGWMPSPIGVTVNSDLNFVAMYEEIVKTIVDESPAASIEEPIVPDVCEQPQKRNPSFTLVTLLLVNMVRLKVLPLSASKKVKEYPTLKFLR